MEPIPIDPRQSMTDLAATVATVGIFGAVGEYGIAALSKRINDEDFFIYHPEEPDLKSGTSPISFIGYGLMGLGAKYIGNRYLYEQGYNTVQEVPMQEWVKMGLIFGVGASLFEWTVGYGYHAVTKKDLYIYPGSKWKYTHPANFLIWGSAGVAGFIASLWLKSKVESNIRFIPVNIARLIKESDGLVVTE